MTERDVRTGASGMGLNRTVLAPGSSRSNAEQRLRRMFTGDPARIVLPLPKGDGKRECLSSNHDQSFGACCRLNRPNSRRPAASCIPRAGYRTRHFNQYNNSTEDYATPGDILEYEAASSPGGRRCAAGQRGTAGLGLGKLRAGGERADHHRARCAAFVRSPAHLWPDG
jgi:hypothetical protein